MALPAVALSPAGYNLKHRSQPTRLDDSSDSLVDKSELIQRPPPPNPDRTGIGLGLSSQHGSINLLSKLYQRRPHLPECTLLEITPPG